MERELIACWTLASLLGACRSTAGDAARERPAWAIAIHGGAGTIPRSTPPEEAEAYRASLRAALQLGVERLEAGASALDVAEAVVMQLEDDPLFNAGRGAVFTSAGEHELDASIMDGATLACGAVTGVRTVRHPIALARAVMERTPHILLAGQGAEDFATEVGLERVENEWFSTQKRRLQLQRALEAREKAAGGGTVGAVVLDRKGHLAAATSTGGMTAKRPGRVGDTPLIGAGNYADDRTCAVSGTGTGEEFIRHGTARAIADRMELSRMTAGEAARDVFEHVMAPGDGGAIVVSKDGELALVFTSEGMFRGAADANGRFEVAIWDE
jgi:L-asparaginase / beta-aspartyl-peptidase